jgi:FkbM family methyltransferase
MPGLTAAASAHHNHKPVGRCVDDPACCKRHPRLCSVAALADAYPRWDHLFPPADLCGLFFIEIGANCGTDTCSHSGDPFWRHMQDYAWQGAVVEANPATFAKLRANYAPFPRVRALNTAASNVSTQLDFFCPAQTGGTVEMCTLSREWAAAQGWRSTRNRQSVRALTLTDLWTILRPAHVSILGLDVEGAEERILGFGDLPSPAPRLLFFENASFANRVMHRDGEAALARVRANLRRQGYEQVRYSQAGRTASGATLQDELWAHATHRMPTPEQLQQKVVCPRGGDNY